MGNRAVFLSLAVIAFAIPASEPTRANIDELVAPQNGQTNVIVVDPYHVRNGSTRVPATDTTTRGVAQFRANNIHGRIAIGKPHRNKRSQATLLAPLHQVEDDGILLGLYPRLSQ
jgi:hypothetical protein